MSSQSDNPAREIETTGSGSTAVKPPTASRSYGEQVMREAFSRLGARMGAAWIYLLMGLAVFAPFIANSYPLSISIDGVVTHPAIQYLHWVDVALLVLFALFMLTAITRPLRKIRMELMIWVGWATIIVCMPFTEPHLTNPMTWGSIGLAAFGLVAGGLRLFFTGLPMAVRVILLLPVITLVSLHCTDQMSLVQPPPLQIFETFREKQAAGEVDWVVTTPIPYSPNDRQRDVMGSQAFLKPGGDHFAGTDKLGQDLASRMVHASRIALSIGFISTGIAIFIGIIIGGLMGYFSGVVDMLGMRLLEVFQAVPTLFLLLTFVAFFGANIYIMMVIIGLTSWPGYARYIRAEFLKLRSMDYVQAGVACGLPLRSILFRHMLPNGVAPLLVGASFGIAGAIIAEATLSFLGLGLQEDPSWGQMLNEATAGAGGTFIWWMALWPGVAIFLTVLAYNLIGEALRDAIDPHLKKVAS